MQENMLDSIVKISIEGLAVCCFKNNIWNVLFTNHDEHEFELLMIKRGSEQSSELLTLNEGCKIVIRAHNVEEPATDDPTFKGVVFDPESDKNHPNDWRWFVNLDEIHRNEVTRTDSAATSSLSIGKCIFYTDTVSTSSYEKFEIKNPSGRKSFGRIGIKAAAKFILDRHDAKVTLEIESPDHSNKSYVLERKNNAWYEFSFRNSRSPLHSHGHTSESDFPLYYNVADTGGEEYDFDLKLDKERRSEAPILCGLVSGGKNLFP